MYRLEYISEDGEYVHRTLNWHPKLVWEIVLDLVEKTFVTVVLGNGKFLSWEEFGIYVEGYLEAERIADGN